MLVSGIKRVSESPDASWIEGQREVEADDE